MDVDPAVLQMLDHASQPFMSYDLTGSALTAALQSTASGNQTHLESLSAAFFFHLQDDGAFEGSFMGSEANPWPRDPTEVPADVQCVWLTYALEPIHPMLRARLRHLLWVAKANGGGCRPIDHLQAAVEQYRTAVPLLLVAEGPLATVSRWKALVALRTAHELAVSTKQPTLSEVVTEMVDLAKSALDWPEAAPGVVGAIVDALGGDKQHHDILRPLVEQAASQYDDPHVRISFLRNLRQMEADAEGQRTLDERISDTYAGHAERLGGFGKLLCLEEGAAHARRAGLTQRYDQFQRQQQALTVEDLKLDSIRTPMELPPGFLEGAAAVIDAARDVGEALAAIAAVCPELPAAKDDRGEEAGLLQVDTVRINLQGPVITKVIPAQVGAPSGLTDRRILTMELHGHVVAAQLDRVGERFTERPEGLVELFSHSVVTPPAKAQSLARAFRAYWAKEDEVAVKLALPAVEGILRRYLKSAGVPIIQHATGERAGQVDQLGNLIRKMEAGGIGESATFFRLLLADPTEGMNLRNDVLHDLIDCPPRHRVALVLGAALSLLRSAHLKLTHAGSQEAGTDTSG
ncbi:hypothetical protein [Streptomyces erythrochromogenes]|uniref:hypothetical protein n=1 Tax=Streptomyces erythrochromogenes TaxID=285574 RepID=UPI0037FC1E96